MDAHKVLSAARAAVISLSLAAALAGCKTAAPATDDASLNTQVQAKLSADQNLTGQSIQATTANGVVTLNGSVTSDSARSIASGDAAQVAGVKTVVDNLVVQLPSPTHATGATTPSPAPTSKPQKPSPMVARNTPPPAPAPAPIVRNTPVPMPAPQPAPAPIVAQAPQPPPQPPAPVAHNITLPAGTAIPIRITETLDSATTQTGDKFTGVIASDIIVDNMVVLPQGTPIAGHVDAAQDAKHFKGSALLTISLTAINHRGEHIACASEAYTKQGEGRGKNTAEKVGGGAAVGAILGGILGGGRGAAIGAAAGGGVGAGANTVTRGQQVQIPSETVIRFKLTDPVIIHLNSGGGSSQNSGPALERHDNQ
jgi:outer membrane biosynthesis protein TonB